MSLNLNGFASRHPTHIQSIHAYSGTVSIRPIHLLLSALAHCVNREQAAIIDCLKEENRVLRSQLGNKRLRFTDAERRRLAVKANVLCRRILREIGSLVTPDTLLRWHRQLVAKKYDGSQSRRGVGRPRTAVEVAELVVQMAKENPSWGYTRIRGALANLGHDVGRSTIARILEDQGIEPSPRRGISWKTFLKAHWEVIAAADMFTVEVWLGRSLVRYHVLFAIDLATRRVEILGIVPEPYGSWMEQVARNATDGVVSQNSALVVLTDGQRVRKSASTAE